MNLKNRLEKLESKTDNSLVKIWFSDNTIKYLTFSEFLNLLIFNMLKDNKTNTFNIKKFEIQKLHENYGLLPGLTPIFIKVRNKV